MRIVEALQISGAGTLRQILRGWPDLFGEVQTLILLCRYLLKTGVAESEALQKVSLLQTADPSIPIAASEAP